jgi:hypothetical protein
MMLSYLKHIALWLGKRKFKAQSKETMFKVKNIILSLALLGCSGLTQAQQVEQRIDSLQILIGQQTVLHLKASVKQGDKVELPSFKPQQQITPGVEVVEHFSDDIENMFSSFLRRNVLLDTVREEDDTYLVIVLNGTEGECGSNLSSQIALHLLHRTEIERPADVYEQHHRQFPFLFKHLDVRLMKAGGHVPVDVSHIIAVLIFAHLGKGHSPTLEGRMILTCEDVLTQSASLDFYLPNLF